MTERAGTGRSQSPGKRILGHTDSNLASVFSPVRTLQTQTRYNMTAPTTDPSSPPSSTPPLLPSALAGDSRPQSTPPRPSQPLPRSPASHSRRTSTPGPPRTAHPLRSSTGGPDSFANGHGHGHSGSDGGRMARVPSETGVGGLKTINQGEVKEESVDGPVEPLNLLKLAGGVVKSRNGE